MTSRAPMHSPCGAPEFLAPDCVPTIIIVEDDEGQSLLIEDGLHESGMRNPIEHLRDGQFALDYFFGPRSQPDKFSDGSFLVLLDIRMPRIDGIEVLRRLKNDPQLRRLPVIMLSTADNPSEIARCYELGCSAYVRKSLDFGKFSETVQRLGAFAQSWLIPGVKSGMTG